MSGDELIQKVSDLAVAGKASPKDGGITMRGDGPQFPRGLVHTRYEHIVHRRVWRDGRWVPISTRKRDPAGPVYAGELVVEWIDDWEIRKAFLIVGPFTPGYRELEVRETVAGEYVRIELPDGRVVYRPSPRS
jgi:hypothetical protein